MINGASDFFVAIFGDKGQHARAAVAVNRLPKNEPDTLKNAIPYQQAAGYLRIFISSQKRGERTSGITLPLENPVASHGVPSATTLSCPNSTVEVQAVVEVSDK